MDSKRRDKGLFKSESSRQSTDYPGMWRVPKNPDNCCIYRVPYSIRRVNPEAYTPQLLIIGMVKNNSTFHHFTDLVRCVSVETLPDFALRIFKHPVEHMYNVDKLNSGGVKFEAVENKFSLYVRFENGCLKMPCLEVYDDLEMKLRNIIALEQCHYPFSAHVCNYVHFLDFLIDTDKDVDLLVQKGIIKNCIGEHGSVAEMVNKLCLGIVDCGSYYYDIAVKVNAHYSNPFNRSHAVLKSVFW